LSFDGYASNVGGALSFTHGSSGTNDGDINRTFIDSVATDDTIFISFLVELDTALAGDYFLHLGPRTIATTFRFRVFAKDSVGASGWLIGLAKSSSGTVYDTTVLAYNKTYLIVGAYVFNTSAVDDDQVILSVYDSEIPLDYENPLTYVGPLGTGTSGDPSDIGSVAIRQGSNGATGKIDAIRVATSWNDVLFDLISISQAREDGNSDLIPDMLGDTLTVAGVVISPNYQTSNRSYYIYDGTGGIDLFRAGSTMPTLNLGDMVRVTGKIDQYNGLVEIIPSADSDVVLMSTGNTVPDPQVLTLRDYLTDPEAYESQLVGFISLTKVSGTWPASGNATLKFTDGVDTVDFFIDSDTDIDGQPEPSYPVDIIGIGGQYCSGGCVDGGYEILPRYYANDFLPPGTLPVELVSFKADVSNGIVSLSWVTATETNNKGFDVERSADNSTFTKIGFVDGKGTTTESKVYSFTDANLGTANTYYYRLKQIDFNGSFTYSKVVQVSVEQVSTFELKQNYPNPFNPSTQIAFTIPQKGFVKLVVYNLLGQEVKTLVNETLDAGSHSVDFNASNLPSGVYIYKLSSIGFTKTRKMMLIK
jgi:hypothetical protein